MNNAKMTLTQIKFNFKNHFKGLIIWSVSIVFFVLFCYFNISSVYVDQQSLDELFVVMQLPMIHMLFGYFHFSAPNTIQYQFVAETAIIAYILVIIANINLTTKLLREKEDQGINDLVLTTNAGKLSPLLSGYILMIIFNLVIFVLSFLLLVPVINNHEIIVGTLLFCASIFLIGFFFLNITILFNELSNNRYTAKAMSMLALGFFFVLRALIDYRFPNQQIFSPLSWGGALKPYTDNRFYVIFVAIAISVIIFVISLIINKNRDVGAGIISSSKGSMNGSKLLNNPFYFRFKVNKLSIIGWSISFVFFGIMFGFLIDSMQLFADNPIFTDMLGGNIETIESMMLSIINIIAITMGGVFVIFALRIFFQIKGEELKSQLDLCYPSKIKRSHYYYSFIMISIISSVLVYLIMQVFMYLGQMLLGTNIMSLMDFINPLINYLPLVILVISIASILYVLLPKLSSFAYLVLGLIFFTPAVGMMLDLPDFLDSLFIFGFLAKSPIEPINFVSWSIIMAISILIIIVCGFIYQKKDIKHVL